MIPAICRLCTRLAPAAVIAACATPASPTPEPAPAARTATRAEVARIEWGIVVHGGAGGRVVPAWSEERRAAYESAITAALRAGYDVLARGGSSLEAVEETIAIMEDDSLFNAGRGAVFTADGRNELDAAIMDGPARRAGAVAGLHRVKNPIRLARAVMERSQHVMMVGDGAEVFAQQVGVELVDPRYFYTGAAWRALERERAAEQRRRDSLAGRSPQGASSSDGASYYGTVGAVARDRAGRLAAGTSTGGRTNKRYGRVGDVPVIGAGTYANDACAVSATGHGEWFIRYTVARDVCADVERGVGVGAAATTILFGVFDPIPVDGGLIVLDARGNLAMSFNTAVMPRGYIGPDGQPSVRIGTLATR